MCSKWVQIVNRPSIDVDEAEDVALHHDLGKYMHGRKHNHFYGFQPTIMHFGYLFLGHKLV